ncbi:hypothetical protein NBT05_15710 [Aquimarina sp. ERC-38]|uniref:hypothetical protein n=1 Tax=Aquimarina sp. ERC-38 TaxID=2949996 RepID=UPI002247758B|nr:hypothetical protein [Aquimarina sp. ERC-38]UZO80389.1 hypothetical protein NBT05_15710 [Aquimarina sp. ERC-38]
MAQISKMNSEQVLTSINILLTSATFLVGYLTYRFYKKKDYEDKIFNMKFETYSKLNELCFNAFNKLNPNNSPLVEIYDYKDKDKWTKYYEKEVMKMDEIALEIERVIMKSSFYLPSETLNAALEFSQYCIKYITQYAHFDTELNLRFNT